MPVLGRSAVIVAWLPRGLAHVDEWIGAMMRRFQGEAA